jgi:hypothetical protein
MATNPATTRAKLQDFAWLHVYAQPIWHGTAYVCGTREGIKALVDSLQRALAAPNGIDTSHVYFASDGESYEIKVRIVLYSEFTDLATPYTNEIAARSRREIRVCLRTEPAMSTPQFCKLDDAGNELPVDAANWSQVLDRQTQLIWCADPLGRAAWKQALNVAAAHTLGGFAWRAPDIREQLSIVDYTRFDPAFDSTYFRGEPSGYWTSTPDPSSPESYAFYVNFNHGLSDIYYQSSRLWVRPVRSVVLPGQ